VLFASEYRPVGLVDPTIASPFPADRCGLPVDASPRLLANPGSSSRELHLSFRAPSSRARPTAFRQPSSSLGVSLPLRGNDSWSPRPTGIPFPSMFRPRRFSRPRRLAPPRASWACFIPQPRPGFTLQGVSPLPSRPTSSVCRALLPLHHAPLPSNCSAGARARNAVSRALIRAAIRCDLDGV
jgi:hypothetical protein